LNGDVPYSKFFIITDEKVRKFAKVSEDNNPIHIDDDYAKDTIFKERIAHGMLIGGFISSVIGNDFPGNGTIYLSQNLKFLSPVKIGSKVKVEIRIIDQNEKGWLKLGTNVKDEYDKLIIEGEAMVIPPKGFKYIS